MALISHCTAYYISFLYIPTEAITHDTWAIAYLKPGNSLRSNEILILFFEILFELIVNILDKKMEGLQMEGLQI